MKRSLIWRVGVLLAIAGCGQAGPQAQAPASGTAGARAQAGFWPTEPDRVWQYEVVAHPADDPYVDYKGVETVTVESVKRRNGATTLVLRAIDDFTSRYRFPEITQDGDRLTLKGVTYWGAFATAAKDLTIDLLRFPLTTGRQWDDGGWTGSVKGRERVKVPAGTFDAYKIGAIGTYEQAYTAVGTYWVAPGVGIVKSELNVPGWIIESEMIPAARRKP